MTKIFLAILFAAFTALGGNAFAQTPADASPETAMVEETYEADVSPSATPTAAASSASSTNTAPADDDDVLTVEETVAAEVDAED